MIRKLNKEYLPMVSSFFEGADNIMISSCLEGEMGEVYLTDEMSSAKLDIGDFCFFGGKADESLVYHKKRDYEKELKILVPQNAEWGQLIEQVYASGITPHKRYGFKTNRKNFSREKLREVVSGLDQNFTLIDIDRCQDIFDEVSRTSWARDWISQFHGYEDYRKRGAGAALKYKGELVAGASSYAVSSKGIEIQIDTKKEFRNQGLGKICGAALILRCLEQGLYPSWDADNEISARLACSLGYKLDREYTVYKIQEKKI